MAKIIVCPKGEFISARDYIIRDDIAIYDLKDNLPNDMRIGEWIMYGVEFFTVAKRLVVPLNNNNYVVNYLVWSITSNYENDEEE